MMLFVAALLGFILGLVVGFSESVLDYEREHGDFWDGCDYFEDEE